MSEWKTGDRVLVSLPDGDLVGVIDKIQDHSQFDNNHRVRFDDPLVYGGRGFGWFSPDALSPEGAR